MPITPKALGQVALTTTAQTVYTVPSGAQATIRNIRVCNTTAGPLKVTAYLMPGAGTPTDANAILKGVTVPAGGVVDDDAIHVREAGGRLVALADAAGLTLTASGAESTPDA